MVLPSQAHRACSEVSTLLCVYHLQPRMQLCDAVLLLGVSTDTTDRLYCRPEARSEPVKR